MNQSVPFSWLARLGCLLALLALTRPAQAQVDDYTFAASTGTFVPLANGTAVPTIQVDDVTTTGIQLGFSFTYDGNSFNQVAASSNGFLSFAASPGSGLSNAFSNTGSGSATERPLIAAFWDDLHGGLTGNASAASYATSGAPGSQVFTFEWLNWARYGSSGGAQFSMQAKLYEGSNRIEFVYRQEANPLTNANASIGLAGAGTPMTYLSLDDSGASPVASNSIPSNDIATTPATGQVYTFAPTPPSPCPAPRGLAITDLTTNSATINFGTNATAQSYTVTYQAAGGPLQTIAPNPTAGPIYLVGLLRNTNYTVTVTANCGGALAATSTVSFSTTIPYCTAGLGGGCGGNNVSSVVVAGAGLNATGLTCTTTANGNAYTSYPATAPRTATLEQGTAYPVSVTTTGTSIVSVWIDFNQNQLYEASEWTQVTILSVANAPNTVTVQVPANAVLGQTGMRVRSRGNGNPNGSGDACSNFGSGETKDFTVTIAPASLCPAATALTATAITTGGATLGFTAPAGGGTYALVYGPRGFDPTTAGAGMTINPATSPVTVTGLQSDTPYDFYVQRTCVGTAGQSSFAGPASFTTLVSCPAATALTATAITATGATLGFTAPAGGGTYTLVYGPRGFNPATAGAGTVINPATSPVTVTGLQPSTPYDFYVRRTCVGAAGQSSFAGPASFTTVVANDEPCSAQALPLNLNCTPLAATLVSATASTPATGAGISAAACGNSNPTPRDVWFSFTTAATGPQSTAVRLSVTGNSAGQVQVFSAITCAGPFTSLGCSNSGSSTAARPLELPALTPSTTYYVRVFSYLDTNAPGPFTICTSAIPNCPEPVALTVNTTTGTTASLSWGSQPLTAGQSFTLVYGTGTTFDPATGGTRLPNLTTTSATLTGLLPSTAYTFYVRRICGGFDGNSIYAGPVRFSTPAAAPANDEPCGALTLGNGPTTGTTAGATNSTQPGTIAGNCSPARQPNDVWFAFTAGASGTVSLTLTGSTAGVARLYSAAACAGPFTAEQCQSAGASNTGFSGPVQFAGLVANARYYLAVSGYTPADVTGSFTVRATGILAARTQADTDALLVYPNPSNTGQLTLRLAPASGPRQAKLLNALGQTVRHETLTGTGTEHSFGTRQLPAGIYTLRVNQGSQTFTRKVVLE